MPGRSSGILASRMSGVPPICDRMEADCPGSVEVFSMLLNNKGLLPYFRRWKAGLSMSARPVLSNLPNVIFCRGKESRHMERKKATDFPQELLNLFDLYVHGDIGRRDFLDGAKKFAVGGLTVAGIFESLRPNYAWAEQVRKDDSRIKTEQATVPSPQGHENIKGYLARPAKASGKLPGVLVVHENRGL